MTILIKKPSDIRPSEITPKSIYLDRRKFMRSTITASMLLAMDSMMPAWAKQWPDAVKSKFSTDAKMNSLEEITVASHKKYSN